MFTKKQITKKDISDLLRAYSVRLDEFEPFGIEGHFFKSKYTKGYAISIEPEIQHGSEVTGRIIVSHTKSTGKRTFCDVWERNSNNKLQFVFRNPWNKPFTDYDYIDDLKTQIKEFKEHQESTNNTKHPQKYSESTASENEALKSQISALTKKNEKLIIKTKNNARGAGWKANPQHLESQVKKYKCSSKMVKLPLKSNRL